MNSSNVQRLRQIRTFQDLVEYLRDELEWPIDSDNFEDLTFDYEPEELGIETSTAVKIHEIKQLRPLTSNQPWGIFFIDFEPKRLPIVVLRRILRSLVVKKRSSANKAHQAVWQLHDLMFISSFGENDHREITFAHFSEPPDRLYGDLPTLRVLGWDENDTKLKLDHIVQTLSEKLRWPEDEANIETWREKWTEAFVLKHREVINTSKDLAVRLAALAKSIRQRASLVLSVESEHGQLRKLHQAFKTALIHDLDENDFADMYAQTIAYGLLAARVSRPAGIIADNIKDMVPVTNPFLSEMLGTFLTVGGRKGKIDFDELGIQDVVDLLNSPDTHIEDVLRDFGNRTMQEDPVIHFYELFLKEYDKKRKVQRGVFYTPQPVVSYIVRSVHELLKTEFGLEDGLASTVTWGEMTSSNPEIRIPEGTSPNEPFVQILDPATGTGTFLVYVIEIISSTMTEKWAHQGRSKHEMEKLWNEYVPNDLLPRLYGFELMMAPYAIAHMKVGLKLSETGYNFGHDERVHIYLTNSLEPYMDAAQQEGLAEWAPAFAHEARSVNKLKQLKRFNVVVGNPPYAVTSSNSNSFIDSLMMDYKKILQGERSLVALADDYLKFVRLSQELINRSGVGIWGMITNHSYIKGLIHRGVRKTLLHDYSKLFVLDLHGDSNIGERISDGTINKNVFDIQQGVAVTIGVFHPLNSKTNLIHHGDSWGTRIQKYQDLSLGTVFSRKWNAVYPTEPNFFFYTFDRSNYDEYQMYPALNELMYTSSCGVKTHRDNLVIDFEKDVLTKRMRDVAFNNSINELKVRYQIKDTRHWNLVDAKKKIDVTTVDHYIFPILYRPFDIRWIYYNPKIIEKGDSKYPTLRHMLHPNLALLTCRIQATGTFDAVFVSQHIAEMKTAESSRSSTVFPLFISHDSEIDKDGVDTFERQPNLHPSFLRVLAEKLGNTQIGVYGLPRGLNAEDIFYYVYAILHSLAYRKRYSDFLRTDFPRLPLTYSLPLFHEIAKLGHELVSLHLMESSYLSNIITAIKGDFESYFVTKVSFSNETVWIGENRTTGFQGVPEDVWDFHIGGYQVCHKWLKDRKGRTLSEDDINQ